MPVCAEKLLVSDWNAFLVNNLMSITWMDIGQEYPEGTSLKSRYEPRTLVTAFISTQQSPYGWKLRVFLHVWGKLFQD